MPQKRELHEGETEVAAPNMRTIERVGIRRAVLLSSVRVFDFDAALEEALGGIPCHLVSPVLGEDKVKGTVDSASPPAGPSAHERFFSNRAGSACGVRVLLLRSWETPARYFVTDVDQNPSSINSCMKEKTSITLSSDLLKKVDQVAGSKVSRSAFIERVLRLYFRERTRRQIHDRDLERINAGAEALNSVAEDVLTYQSLED